MKYINKLLVTLGLTFAASGVNAAVINFIDLTQNTTTGLGESAWTTLSLSADGIGLNIFGGSSTDNDPQQYAYLDWGNAGLGVCKDAGTSLKNVNTAYTGSSANLCSISSDDNITTGEYLDFVFDQDVIIDSFWFNNNHDGGFDISDLVTIGGNDYSVSTGYAGGANGIGSFAVAANTAIRVAFKNEQFYIGGIEFKSSPSAVSEPSSFLAMVLGLFAFGVTSRKHVQL